MELKELYEEYERVTSLGMIPFYQSRLRALSKQLREHNRKKQMGKIDEQEGVFIDQTIKDVKFKLRKEKKLIKELGGKLYRTWTQLKEIRQLLGYKSTSAKLTVTEIDLPKGNKKELFFHMSHDPPDTVRFNGKGLPRDEKSRRSQIKSLRTKIKLMVNGQTVSKTHVKHAKVNFPSFDVDIGESF